MKEAEIKSLLSEVYGTRRFERQGEWVMSPCPLAPWTHEKKTDSNPSFGVHIADNDKSIFNCFTCGHKGPMSRLVQLRERFTGENHGKLVAALQKEEAYQAELPEWGEGDARTEKPEPLPRAMCNLYPSCDPEHDYLHSRYIRPVAARLSGALYDDDDHGAERIVLPIYGLDGKCYGYTGRAIDSKVTPKVRDYHGLKKKSLLLGMHRVDDSTDRIILVEGLFDYLNLIQYGHVALAVMHSGLTDHQADLVREIGKPTYLMYDNDAAGRKGVEEASKKLTGYVPVMVCDWPDFEEEYGVYEDGDPGDLTNAEVEYLLREAQIL